MAKSPNWTEAEKELLSLHYPRLGKCKELEQMFPTRNLSAVCLKANRLGFKVLNDVRKGRTDSEYKLLLKNTPFESLEPYIGSTYKILHRCLSCTNEWQARPQQLLREGAKCPVCSLSGRFTDIETVDKVLGLADMERLSPYTGALDTIRLKHLYCGHVWEGVYSYVQQGSGCPKCNKGFGYMHGKDMPEKALLYLLKIKAGEETFLKVGVTSRASTAPRIKEHRHHIPSIHSIESINEIRLSGSLVLDLEHFILSRFPRYTSRYTFPGHTELKDLKYLTEINEIINKRKP